MSRKFIQFILLLGMFFFYGCDSFLKENQSISASEKFEIKNDPNIVFGKLENGFQYALMKNAYPEERILTALNFNVGSAMEEERERGLAHFLEHMAFRGSHHFPRGKIVQCMQNLGIAFGHELNAYTSFLNTCYLLDLPNGDEETVHGAFLAFRDFCDGLSLLDEDVNQERGVILSEKRDQKNVFQKFFKESLKFTLKGTIFPNRLPIGKTKVIQEASAKDLRHFYEKWYSPEKMFFVAVGNLDIQKFEKQIREMFQNLPAKTTSPKARMGTLKYKKEQFFYFSDPDISATTVEVSAIFFDLFPVDNYEAHKHRMVMEWVSNILRERLRDKKFENPLLFSGGEISFVQNFLRTKYSLFQIEINCEYKNWPQCLSLLERETRKICKYGISEGELQRQRELSLNCAESNLLAAKTRHSSILLNELLAAHSMGRKCTSPENNYALAKALNGDITAEDCRLAFCNIWKNLHISLLTNETMDKAESAMKAALGKSRATAISANDSENLAQFAYEHFETPHREIIQRNYIEDLDITQITLANGVKINLKPTNFRQNQIKMILNIGHGMLTNYPHPEPGIFLAASQSFLGFGLKKNLWKDLKKLLSSKCIQMDFRANEHSFYFSGGCDKKNLLLELQLATAYLSDPGFEERSLFETREEIKQIYQDRQKFSDSIKSDQYQKFITGNDVIFGLPEEQSVSSVTVEDIKNLLLPIFQREAIELTLVGDFELETAIQNIQDTLGSLPQRSPSQNAVLDSGIANFPKEVSEKSFFFTGDEKHTLSILAFSTDDENNVKDNHYLITLSKIIGDRLISKIRKEQGKTYSPTVNHCATPFKNFGLFEILLSLDSESIYDTKKETLSLIEDLKTNPISQEELDRSKLPLLNNIRDRFKNNDFWIDHITYAHRHPEHLENLRTMRTFYENISSQDLLETAQKYLNNPIHITFAKQPFIAGEEN
ncbi:MAG: insulinase family protein [Puniceicoccales bacterium]|jgi:zinc protease|nr:insulinase family protein [Puniceicoccales bacterium]